MMEAYKNWNKHLNEWIIFLTKQKQTLNDDDPTIVRIIRQLKYLYEVKNGAVATPMLLETIINPNLINKNYSLADSNINFYQKDLNNNQRDAVKKALNCSYFSMVQGPPGTGKTKVITEICLQIVLNQSNSRILICSETHVAVNNVLERLSHLTNHLNMVRIRNKESDSVEEVKELEYRNYLELYFDSLERANINPHSVKLIKDIFSQIDDRIMHNKLEKLIIQSAQVVGITCNGLAAYQFYPDDKPFDYVIIDEVCKATLPEILIPMTRAKKLVLVGDPKQLPPLFCRDEVELMNETDTTNLQNYQYIDRLFEITPKEIKTFLNKQFRMTNEIGNIISQYFYKEEKLENGLNRSDPDSICWANYDTTQRWPTLINGKENIKIYNNDEVSVINQIIDYEYKKLNFRR